MVALPYKRLCFRGLSDFCNWHHAAYTDTPEIEFTSFLCSTLSRGLLHIVTLNSAFAKTYEEFPE